MEGDWIVGLGSKSNPTRNDYSGRIVYVMKVTRKMTMADYDGFTAEHLAAKVPVVHERATPERDSNEWRMRLGDSIYDFSRKDVPQRRGVHRRENRRRDMSGKYALLSDEFVYFGDQAIPVPGPLEGIMHSNQGHRSRGNSSHLHAFLDWWEANSRQFASNRVRGVPQLDVFQDRETLGACADAHFTEADRDNRLYPE